MTTDFQPRYEPEPEDEDMLDADTALDLTPKQISGMGRDSLLVQIDQLKMALVAERACGKAAYEELIAAKREAQALNEQVTSLQVASTHALTCSRLERRLLEEPALTAALLDLAWGIDIAREKHPEGSDLTSLVSEVGEVAKAMFAETPARVRAELVDVAVVALRIVLGEVKAQQVGFDAVAAAPPHKERASVTVSASSEVVIAALLERVGGRAAFTDNELRRAEQRHLDLRGDGHRLELWTVSDT